MSKQRALVIDDEEDILELVRYNLVREGFEVFCVETGEDGLEAARTREPDLIFLDLMLPEIDGLEVCARLRKDGATAKIPIIMLTARGEESDIVKGLNTGADDYVVKPFSPKVLVARARAVLRSRELAQPDDTTPLRAHEITIHPGRHEATVNDKPTEPLTSTEFKLLHLLARRPGWVMTRRQIVEGVRGESIGVTERSVDVQIVGLRRKLGEAGQYIETVRGVGYRFKE